MPGNRGNSNFCFLCGSVFGKNVAVGTARSAGLGNPIVQSLAIVRLISRNEEKLLATMTEEQKEWFSRYTDCIREHQAMVACLLLHRSIISVMKKLEQLPETK